MTLDPIKLFDELDKSNSSIKTLRQTQREVLEKYSIECQNKPRIGIRLSTGAGKSLIALLILESWRRAGKNVAILAATSALAKDLESKAKEIGIPVVTIFGSEGEPEYRQQRTRNLTWYKQKRAIGIFNYYSYLYATEYREDIVPPYVLVIDDANEFEVVRSDFFSIRIDRDKFGDIYNAIVEKLRSHFQVYPNLQTFLEGTGERADAIEVIHFTHAKEVIDVINRNLSTLGTDTTFRLSYERNKEALDSFLILVTNYEIELRPMIIPEEVLKLTNIPQIIFMGATLYPTGLLHKSFGIRKSIIHLIKEEDLSDAARDAMEKFGRRLILPVDIRSLEKHITDAILQGIMSIVKTHKKALVLANSKATARTIINILNKYAVPVLFYQKFENGEEFKAMPEGVLVCANRYVGLDFAGGTCKVCCIVNLPMFLEPLDMFHYSVLANYSYIEQKVANRLVQAFGRCNRLETDEAIYFMLDPRILARFTGEEQYFNYFPRRIHAETYTGFYMSEEGTPASAFGYAESKFFGIKDPNYETLLADEKKNWTAISATQEEKYELEIEAWEKSMVASYETAAQLFELLAEQTKDSNQLVAAWYYYLAAMNYYNAYNHYKAEGTQKRAQENLKNAVETGGNSSWFNRLRSIFNELVHEKDRQLKLDFESIEIRRVKEQIISDYDNYINTNNSRKKNWQASFTELKKELQTGTHGQMLVGLEQILTMLGYKVRRGNNKKGEPDLIAISSLTVNKYQLSIEVKTKEEGEIEKKENVSQALADATVLKQRSSTDYETFAVLITQKEEFSPDALRVAPGQVRLCKVIEFTKLLDKLYSRIERWATLTTTHQRQFFIDSIISPHELLAVFKPQDKPELSAQLIDEVIADI